jgi:3-methylfumaryl-CoA hydratase
VKANSIALRDWIGRTSEADDIVTPRLAASFRATLSPHLAEADETIAPLGIHWCLAPEIVDTARLNANGHAATGDFLPPVHLPRRMWAGSDVRFLAPLHVNDHVRRRSTVSDISEKDGKSGSLCFVTVRHELENQQGPVVEESQTIVYREAASASTAAPEAALPRAPHLREVDVDPVLLFRYSALTFNGHRIHYDAPYTMQVEHYPGLVIHGPLQATLLLNFAAIVGKRAPQSFSFRSVRPATGAQRLRLCAAPDQNEVLALRVEGADGSVTMKAAAAW